MARKNDYDDKLLWRIAHYTFWFFGTSVWFMLMNIPFIMLFLFTDLLTNWIGWLYIGLLPVAPAVSAVFYSMGKVVRDKDLNVTKDFFKGYKQSFKQSFIIGAIQSIVLVIAFLDINIFANTSKQMFVLPVAYFALMFIGITSTYIYPLISRFSLKISDIIRLSIIYSFQHLKSTALNIVGCVAWYLSLIYISHGAISMLVGVGMLGFLIMYNNKNVLSSLEEQIKSLTAPKAAPPREMEI